MSKHQEILYLENLPIGRSGSATFGYSKYLGGQRQERPTERSRKLKIEELSRPDPEVGLSSEVKKIVFRASDWKLLILHWIRGACRRKGLEKFNSSPENDEIFVT